ncbi:MAG TPA: 16S rRNA (adenine(1518)-N(6)/adenine(1519)-N(6))-dimethyltransferase RsmA [Candidatus Paceibacterota bacterium]|nr:16S rRNA (adenine(1518)-N(6)/adenine(1519)-N(6))-dimethyltransferase RsmA [Verrucomicrobiota bacterium]HSA09416.1 16S rRNA (adenine(1518)-N(6)/adenine(1519)-N(6))-dimethyltransferase RsmA [Candidatus Paceibacterota bacterium]
MKLTEMKLLLAEHGILLTKSLGQNFLHDANQIRRIMMAAELKKSDRVLEVGPGLGPLTELLVEQAGEVLAIEKDARLVEVLKLRFRPEAGKQPVLRLLHGDALEYLSRDPHDWSGWKLVANLPFSVASLILVELATKGSACAPARESVGNGAHLPSQAGRGPERIVITLQLEVAKRLLAKAGAPDYGVLTLLVQLEYELQDWFKIPASCFFPEPDVDSACICLLRRKEPLLPPEPRGAFARIIKRSFSQRRKMMLKLLKEDWPELRLIGEFERLNLSPQIRAEEVSLEQFVSLAQALSQGPG